MHAQRRIGRGVALVLGGVLVVAGLAGCARQADVDVRVGEDPAVESVHHVSGKKDYQVTLKDSLDAGELAEASVRLADMTKPDPGKENFFDFRSGDWQWSPSTDEQKSQTLAEMVTALSDVEGIYEGAMGIGENGEAQIVGTAAADIDPADLVDPIADAVEGAGLDSSAMYLSLTDLHERREIESRDIESLRSGLDIVVAAAGAGDVLSYTLDDDDDGVNVRMRTGADAAAAAPAIDAVAAASGIVPTVTSGLIAPDRSDPATVEAVNALLEPIEGVVAAREEWRSAQITVLMVTTADVETALAVEQLLTTSPAIQPYRSLQISVQSETEPGDRIVGLSTSDSGYVGSLAAAVQVADTEGVRSAIYTPSTMKVVLDEGADVAVVAEGMKSVALRDQEVEVYDSTPWGPRDDWARFEFSVKGKLHPDLFKGYADGVQEFVDAWNAAPGI